MGNQHHAVFELCSLSSLGLSFESEGLMCLQMTPKLLPMIFMITADIAGGNATIGEAKWDVAKTTPNEEFCIPTCEGEMRRNKMRLLLVLP